MDDEDEVLSHFSAAGTPSSLGRLAALLRRFFRRALSNPEPSPPSIQPESRLEQKGAKRP
jgi:hypothetical protein